MSAPVLVCFALAGEAKPFRNLIRNRANVSVLVTGMARRNTEYAIEAALKTVRPRRVFTCGVAGALDPALRVGHVLFHTCVESIASELRSAGATPGTFSCEDHVLITRAEKAALRQRTKADAVEMESAFIQIMCAQQNIECATVRAISDTANDDLPLDFNSLRSPRWELSPSKLALAILTAPQLIPALVRLGRNNAFAAKQLATVLGKII